ncbi:hypothetical protein [Pelagovum pacificum]|uniref:hypothetical protein n=1 Tax=Pelagovum pacificum TaxID=2588711 RepID=UPI001E311473|nr:hypothetical protein [Pelagovum pacificum]
MREGLEQARKKAERRKSRLRLEVGDRSIRVLRSWSTGFALDREEGGNLRGLVDLFEGSKHIAQCLILTSREDGDELIYEIKRATPAADKPPVDFEQPDFKPAGYLPPT